MNVTISSFWTAVIASVILTATALLLDGNEHAGKVIIGEISAFGIRLGDQAIKSFGVQQSLRLQRQIELETLKKPQ